MAETITWELLRGLAGFRAQQGCAISLFLNLDPSLAPTQPDVATRISALLAEAERRAGELREQLTHEQRQALKADLGRIEQWFQDEFDRDGARGAAVFADGLDGLWSTLTTTEPVPDGVRLGDELALAPLAALVGSGDGVLVAYIGRERADVYRLRAGRLVELADESDEVPGRHDQGGWSQARYERHIEALVERHLRRVSDTLATWIRKLRGVRVVLVGAEEIRSDFETLISNETRERVIGWTTAERHASPAELLVAAEPLLERSRVQREESLLGRWREEASRNGRASAGWEQTLEAASDGRVELLLVDEGAGRAAYRCPECGRGQANGGSCPLDGAELEPYEAGLDLAVHQTLAHGGIIEVIRSHRDLDPVEGIGALLRF